MKVGIQQRVLPIYWLPFLSELARMCRKGLHIFAGEPRPDEAIHTRLSQLIVAQIIFLRCIVHNIAAGDGVDGDSRIRLEQSGGL